MHPNQVLRPCSYPNFMSKVLWATAICLGSIYTGFSFLIYLSFRRAMCYDQIYQRYEYEQATVESVIIGAIIGAIFVRCYMDKISRRKLLMIGDLVGLVGLNMLVLYLLLANSEDPDTFCESKGLTTAIIAEIISGIAVGILSSTSLIMVGEMSPVEIRGVLGVLYFALLAVGYLLESLFEVLAYQYQNRVEVLYMQILGFQNALLVTQIFLIRYVYKEQPTGYQITIGANVQKRQPVQVVYQQRNLIVTDNNVTLQSEIGVVQTEVTRNYYVEQNVRQSLLLSGANQQIVNKKGRQLAYLLITYQQLAGFHFEFNGIYLTVDYLVQAMVQAIALLVGAAIIFGVFLIKRSVKRVTFIRFILVAFLLITVVRVVGIYGGSNQSRFIFDMIWLVCTILYAVSMGPVIYLYIMEILRPKLLAEVMIYTWVLQSVTGALQILIRGRALAWIIASLYLALLLLTCRWLWRGLIETDNKHPVMIRMQMAGE